MAAKGGYIDFMFLAPAPAAGSAAGKVMLSAISVCHSVHSWGRGVRVPVQGRGAGPLPCTEPWHPLCQTPVRLAFYWSGLAT